MSKSKSIYATISHVIDKQEKTDIRSGSVSRMIWNCACFCITYSKMM